jgi:hypothetical protein
MTMTSGEKLAQELHRAKYVYYDEPNGTVIAWYGGAQFSIYSAHSGEELGLFNTSNPEIWDNTKDMGKRLCAVEVKIEQVTRGPLQEDEPELTYLDLYCC